MLRMETEGFRDGVGGGEECLGDYLASKDTAGTPGSPEGLTYEFVGGEWQPQGRYRVRARDHGERFRQGDERFRVVHRD